MYAVAGGRTAHPVDLSTGLKIETATDIAFGGARGGLELTRLYTTDLATTCDACPFGRGMTHNYAIRLTGNFEKDGAGRVLMPGEIDGRLFSYLRTEGDGALVFGTTATTVQLGDVVRKLTNGTYEYRYRNGDFMRFDATGRLTALVDRNGNTTTLNYLSASLVITDPVGRALTLTLNSGRITRATDPLGREWQYEYDGGGRLKTVTDPLLFTMKYDYDTFSRLHSMTDRRNIVVKKISYDAAGRVNKQVFADGSFERYDYVQAGTVITEAIVTNSRGRTASVRFNASGYVVGSTDPLGQTATIKRNMLTNLPEEISGPCGCVESKRQYDDKGNLKVLTDRRGQKTLFDYDPVFNHLTQVTDRLGRISKWGYDSKGNLTSFTDALERKTTFGLDSFGVVRTLEDPLRHVTTLEYDDAGFLKKVTDSLTNATLYEFDKVGRLKKATDGEGRIVTLGYDDNDRLTSVLDPAGIQTTFAYDKNANLEKVINKLNRTWMFAYDLKNRLIRATDPLNKVVQYRYNTDNELTAILSPSGRVVRYEYDPRGQARKMIEPNGNEVNFGYDHVGNLITLRDQRGSLTTFGYDDLYRMNTERDPLGRTSSYQFDAVGNLTEVRDRLNRTVTIKPDKLNRPETVIFRDATITYKYDEAYRLKRIEDTASGDAPPTFVEWDYDDANRVKSETTPQGIVKYEYNKAHQRRTMTAADRPVVNYGYDPAGRLKTITQGVETFTWSYDDLSLLEKLERPNGVTTTYSYDEADKLARLTHKNAAGFALEDFQYSYTPDDEIEAIVSLASPQLLPSAKTASAADAANRLPQFGQASYTFDEEGQTTTKTDEKGTTQYGWDARGRLTKVTLPNGQTVSYGYDALGRRNSRTVNGATTQFLYDGLDVVLDRATGSTVDYLNGAGIDQKLRQGNISGGLYFLRDHLGSTVLLTNSSGGTVERLQYEAFGSSSGSSLTRYQYTGRERDVITGLTYYRARWYDHSQDRFITEDPVGIINSSNLYQYVDNTPINKIDPPGLWGVGFVGGGVIEAGDDFRGGGFQANSGLGVFWGGSTGINLGGYTASGGFIGALDPSRFVWGATAGLGSGLFFTTANCAQDLLGPFDTWTLNLPGVSLQYATDGKVKVFGITGGKSLGFSLSRYPVTTTTASGCPCPQ
jgi:RHS repeat-associated protein